MAAPGNGRYKSCDSDLQKPSYKDVLKAPTVGDRNNKHTKRRSRVDDGERSENLITLKNKGKSLGHELKSSEHEIKSSKQEAEENKSRLADVLLGATLGDRNNKHTKRRSRVDDGERSENLITLKNKGKSLGHELKSSEHEIKSSKQEAEENKSRLADMEEALSRETRENRGGKFLQIPPSLHCCGCTCLLYVDGRSENVIISENKIKSSKQEAEENGPRVEHWFMVRELLNKNIYTVLYDKGLMKKARDWFSEDFPKESEDLFNIAKRLFGKDFNLFEGWHRIGKLWNLLILQAFKFPKKASWYNFGELMRLGAERYRQEFTWENFQGLMETVRQNPNFLKKFQVLMKELPDENLYPLMKLGRDVFQKNFPHKEVEELMTHAHKLFPEEFPQERYTDSYRVMIAILVNQNSILKDEKLLATNKRKLDRLRDVAINFQWSNNVQSADKGFGEQFFLLCEQVAVLNRDVSHPPLEGPRMDALLKSASEGLLKVRGRDVGHAINLLYSSRTSTGGF